MPTINNSNIGSNVTTIGRSSFENSATGPQVSTVTIHAITPPTAFPEAFRNPSNITCYVPAGSGTAYQSATGWSSMTIVEMT